MLASTERHVLIVLGSTLRRYRRARGLSCRDLSQRAGVALGTISHLENGLHCPTRATLGRLLEALALDEASIAAIWALWAATNWPGPPRELADPTVIKAQINEVASLRFRAWQRGDALTAGILTEELEALWQAYRVAEGRRRASSAMQGEG
ncbi:helix-turn-helix transcriptional regulator (plasmid) [Thermomicrobium sp. 4228-Ro]|uniref:helix-turn-helix domain-containing protein n=1 Tax=Thermomicrobium sp. 4228-Ro TaxID=2993937 RepID=UPI002249627D|nr:helix-turn-helix transcriptional regulator [Thermomicrobium sp. 4228-Ro]MCX2728540.1 helix-turn-helix transcriptional regulator [Thermomicrobium sp. 4228-Ro]